MKSGIHPKTQLVIFEDAQTKKQYLIESTIHTKEKATYEVDGKDYPVVRLEVTADSHPFYTGALTYVQAAGRVDKFNKRYQIDTDKKN